MTERSYDSDDIFYEFESILPPSELGKCGDIIALFNYFMAVYSREIFSTARTKEERLGRVQDKYLHTITYREVFRLKADKAIIAIRVKMSEYRRLYKNEKICMTRPNEQVKFIEFLNSTLVSFMTVISVPVFIRAPRILEILAKYQHLIPPKPIIKSKHLNYEKARELGIIP
jgi:hypothetical protein